MKAFTLHLAVWAIIYTIGLMVLAFIVFVIPVPISGRQAIELMLIIAAFAALVTLVWSIGMRRHSRP